MRFKVARQPAGLAVATSIAIIALAVIRSILSPFPVEMPYSSGMPLAALLDSLIPAGGPRHIFAVLVIIINTVLASRLTIIYKATFGRSFITFVLYSLAAAGILFPANSVIGPTTSLLLVLSSGQAISAFRRSYRFSEVFNSAFLLGFIPLLYSPAICLVTILAATLVIYRRDIREVIVAVAALLLPWLLCSVGWWFAGFPFGHLAQAFARDITGGAAVPLDTILAAEYLPSLILIGVYALIIIASLIILAAKYGQYANRVRSIYLHFTLLLVCCLGMLLLPSGNIVVSLSLLAIPSSVLGTHFFVRAKNGLSLGLYAAALAAFLAANILPLF